MKGQSGSKTRKKCPLKFSLNTSRTLCVVVIVIVANEIWGPFKSDFVILYSSRSHLPICAPPQWGPRGGCVIASLWLLAFAARVRYNWVCRGRGVLTSTDRARDLRYHLHPARTHPSSDCPVKTRVIGPHTRVLAHETSRISFFGLGEKITATNCLSALNRDK